MNAAAKSLKRENVSGAQYSYRPSFAADRDDAVARRRLGEAMKGDGNHFGSGTHDQFTTEELNAPLLDGIPNKAGKCANSSLKDEAARTRNELVADLGGINFFGAGSHDRIPVTNSNDKEH